MPSAPKNHIRDKRDLYRKIDRLEQELELERTENRRLRDELALLHHKTRFLKDRLKSGEFGTGGSVLGE